MVPEFYVFDTFEACKLILNIESQGFNAFVCEKGVEYLKDRMANSEKYRIFRSETEPILGVFFDEPIKNWPEVSTWVTGVIINGESSEITPEDLNFQKPFVLRRESKPIGVETTIDGVKSHVLSTPPAEIDLKKGYNFHSFYDEAVDIKYYEVTSPSSETPFTVVVSNFSKKDDSWLFSDIYASNAWAANNMECRYDFHFLTVLWKHLNLPGEFSMDVVKRRVDACYPDRVKNIDDLESEPSVYRRAMLEVIGMKRKRISGESEFIKPTNPRLA